MNIKNVKMLAEIMEQTGVNLIEITEGEAVIRMERNITPMMVNPITEPFKGDGSIVMETLQGAANMYQASQGIVTGSFSEVKSPMVGVFYAAPAPEAENYVSLGSRVKRGDVLCIIEAMKLLNEITAEQEGEIVEICVADGSVVEFGQTLFKIQ